MVSNRLYMMIFPLTIATTACVSEINDSIFVHSHTTQEKIMAFGGKLTRFALII